MKTKRTALIVIDPQKVYTTKDSELRCKDWKATIDRINSLIKAFSAAKLPVIFVRHVHKTDGSDLGRMFDFTGETPEDFNFKEGTQEVEYEPRLLLPNGYQEITKNRYSAFIGTSLGQRLAKDGVTDVAIVGFMTNFCCESTARDAHDLDYFVDFIPDATGTPGTESMNEKEVRAAVSDFMSLGFARVSNTNDFLKSLSK
jgi:nicotinamidase-related amidase